MQHPPSTDPNPCFRSGWFVPLLIFLAALAWRLPYTLTVQTFFLDETAFAHPTIRQILAGEFPIYLYSNAYMAPAQEWMAAGLVKAWGESLWTLRLPCVVCGCLGIVLLYLNLLRVVSRGIALALVTPLICTNSYTGIYTAFGIPSYAIATVFAALLQAAAFRVDQSRSWMTWAALGALGGLSAYVFKILAIQFGVVLVWLLLRSRAWRESVGKLRADAVLRRRFMWALSIGCMGALMIAPVSYRYLTRADTFQRSSIETVAVIVGLGGLALGALMARRAWRGTAGEWGCVAGCVALAAVVYFPPEVYFVVHEKPRLEAQGIKLWEGSKYQLKHAHEWPFQARLFFERVFATVLTGRVNELGGGQTLAVSLGWRAVLSGAFFAALIGAAAYRWFRGGRPDFRAPQWLLIAPVFLVIALMLPSWQLNNDWCGRYLLPFQVGLHLALYFLFAPWIHRNPRTSAALLGAYALYCGLDTYWHTPD